MKKVLLSSFFISLLILLFIEYLLGFAPQSREEEIYSILVPDKKLLWRVRPQYNQVFFGAQTQTNAEGFRFPEAKKCSKESFKIAILGESPSFGWGVPDDKIYSSLLERSLLPKHLCVFNFSQIGFSSTQGKYLLQEILAKQKFDLVVLAYFVNDVDYIRFFYENNQSDQEVINTSRPAPSSQILLKSNLAKLARRLRANKLIISNEDQKTWPGNPRVTLEEYKKNYEEMIGRLKGLETKIILLKNHMAIPRFNLNCPLELNNSNLQEILQICPYHLEANLTQYLMNSLTLPRLQQSLSQRSLTISDSYFEILKKLSLTHRIPLINMSEDFSAHPKQYFNDYTKDGIHPNSQGHEQIAKRLSSVIHMEILK